MDKLKEIKLWLETERDKSIQFWLENGWDKQDGGLFTSLDRKGGIFSTDKSVWMQGRTSWLFSYLYNRYKDEDEFLALAKSCIDFSDKHAFNPDADGRMYFSLTEDGQALRQRRYLFSELFYALGCMEYYKATGEEEQLQAARDTYALAVSVLRGETEDPFVIPEKTCSKTRSLRSLSADMIIINVGISFAEIDEENKEKYVQEVRKSVSNILDYHYKEDSHLTYENVAPGGEDLSDISEARLMNPGHVIECAWFMMDASQLLEDESILAKAYHMLDKAYELGWDQEYGGLLYFIDVDGKPVYQLESDMKLWWPQTELLIASIMAYNLSGEEKYLELFKKVFDYWKQNFADEEYGDCYGYLHYDNTLAMSGIKGGMYKGPFHTLRALQFCVEELEIALQK